MKKCSGRIQTAILSAAMCMALAGAVVATNRAGMQEALPALRSQLVGLSFIAKPP